MKLASRILLVSVFALSLSSCKFFPGVHKLNIQQGHIITPEMVSKLNLGMTKKQVRFILGNTLLPDTFNDNRWDYFYSLKRGYDGSVTTHLFRVYFEKDVLVKTEGDYLPGPAPLTGDDAKKYVEDAKHDMPLPSNSDPTDKDESKKPR